MEKNLQQLFQETSLQPESNLSVAIWQHIRMLDERRRRLQAFFYSLAGLFSFAALFPVIHTLSIQFSQSGLSDYLSLAFSDSSVITTYWKEFALSIVDALPMTTIILSCALLFIFLLSVKRAVRRLSGNSLTALA